MDRPSNFFNFDDLGDAISRTLAPGIATRIVVGDKAMFSVVDFEPNSEGSIHNHPEEQWGILLQGSGVRIQDGEHVPVGQGDFWCSPGGVDHGFIAGPEGARVVDIFAPPRDAYRQSGDGFGT